MRWALRSQRATALTRFSCPLAVITTTWAGRGAPRPPEGSTGLYHFAILYPDRAALAEAVRRVLAHGIALEGASDHGVSEAVYLRDPDGNGIELYRDRPESEWPRSSDGGIAMRTGPLDLPGLIG